MNKKETPKKQRINKYEEKLKVNVTFDEVLNLMLTKPLKKKSKSFPNNDTAQSNRKRNSK